MTEEREWAHTGHNKRMAHMQAGIAGLYDRSHSELLIHDFPKLENVY